MFLYQFIFFWLLLVIWLILAFAATVLMIFGLFLRRNFFKEKLGHLLLRSLLEYHSGLADLNDLDKKTSKIKKIIFNIFDK